MIKYAIQRLSKNEKNLKNSKYDQLLYLSKHIL